MYYWRKMTEEQREDARRHRRIQRYPKHSPPHFDMAGECSYLFTAACYEHMPIIGESAERLTELESELLDICNRFCSKIYGWCVLPNHYHVFLRTEQLKALRAEIGKLHGRTSFRWNGEDGKRGRQVWHNCFEKAIRGPRHHFATLNYVLHNPVRHRLVERWQDWIWSSAAEYLEQHGREEAARIWNEYPVLDYGNGWDEP